MSEMFLPKYVSPFVVWLAHKETDVTGRVFEVNCGDLRIGWSPWIVESGGRRTILYGASRAWGTSPQQPLRRWAAGWSRKFAGRSRARS